MPYALKTLKFAARADATTMRAIWETAFNAHRYYNSTITAALDRRDRWLRSPSTDDAVIYKRHLSRLSRLKRSKQAVLNMQACKKVKLPKEWVARFKVAVASTKEKLAALPKDPVLTASFEALSEFRESRRCPNLTVEEQAKFDAKLLNIATAHPVALNRVQLEIEARATQARLRGLSGLHSSTYSPIETSADQAIKTTKRGRVKRRVWRLRQSHRVGFGVVPNNGSRIAWDSLQLQPLPTGTWGTHTIDVFFGAKKNAAMHQVQVNIHRSWAKKKHHQIPSGAQVRTAWLQLVKRKGKWDLELCLTTEMFVKQQREVIRSSIGIDTGFRGVGESIRVASLSTGEHVDTPARNRRRIAFAQDLLSKADMMTREFWTHYYGAIPTHAGREWPVGKLHQVVMGGSYVREHINGKVASRRWHAGDRSFEVYRLQRKHLTERARGEEERARCSRQDLYRKAAAKLAEDYDLVGVEDLKLSNMARGRIAGGNRVEAAPSILLQAIAGACKTYGANFRAVPAMYTSQRCSACNEVHPSGTARDGVSFKCPSCGFECHADTNAALNIRRDAEKAASGVVMDDAPEALAAE